jgi:ribose transport system ATP-binding protein
MPFLEVLNISKTFPGVKALDRVNLEVPRGGVLAPAGGNGPGPSTML